MQKLFSDFVYTLRQQGLPVSPAETLDALRVAELLGFSDRAVLREGLGLALAKTTDHKLVYDHYFDQFFRFAETAETLESDNSESDEAQHKDFEDSELQQLSSDTDALADEGFPPEQETIDDLSSLSQMLLSDDSAAMAVAIATAGSEQNVQQMQIFTQKPLFTYRIMNSMGNERLNQELLELDESSELGDRQLALELRRGQARLLDQVKDYVEQQYLLFAEAKGTQLRESTLQSVKLTNVDFHYVKHMSQLVQKAARKLASLHSRRRKVKKRGMLDVRKTIAANAAYDGVMFHTRWRSTKVDRPKIIAICDVSGSVSRVARFLLLFLYSLQDVLPRTRSFVFSSDMAEVSALFKEQEVEAAIGDIMAKWANQSTSYAKALEDFETQTLADIDNKTTVIMLGDARNNNADGRADIWQKVYQRAGRVLWLNPESSNSWDTGDSIMADYRPFCSSLHSCNSLRDLERILGNLLKHS